MVKFYELMDVSADDFGDRGREFLAEYFKLD